VVGKPSWERYDARKSALRFVSTNTRIRSLPAMCHTKKIYIDKKMYHGLLCNSHLGTKNLQLFLQSFLSQPISIGTLRTKIHVLIVKILINRQVNRGITAMFPTTLYA